MLLIVQLLVLLNVEFGVSFNDFPSLIIANATIAIVIERPFFERKAARRKHTYSRRTFESNVDGFTRMISIAAEERIKDVGVGIEMSVIQDTNANLARDYTALLSIASCGQTWNLYKRARKEDLVHLAITEPDCPRLPIDHGLSVPILEPGEELPQIFIDLRMDRIFAWRKINVLYDRYFERNTIGRFLRALTGEIPNNSHLGLSSEFLISTDSAETVNETKILIGKALSIFQHHRRSEENFLVLVDYRIVPSIIEVARSLGMLHPESQWLYVLPHMPKNLSYVSGFSRLLDEGENIAFVFNDTNYNHKCRAGIECHAKEMIGALGAALEKAFEQEFDLHERVTEEEFDGVRMTKAERAQQLIDFVRAELREGRENGSRKCGDCTAWKMTTGITWGNSFGRKNKNGAHRLMDVGYWTPGMGPSLDDLLFPHSKYGFRGKTLPIATYHNPPWQYMTKSKKDGKMKWDGLVFDILDQLSRRLNFTYQLVDTDVATRGTTQPASELSGNRSDFGVEVKEFIRASTSSGEQIPQSVRELVSGGNVLMAACATTITERLKNSFNFTVPISVQTYGLLASRPKQISRVMLFASPYTTESWACLAGSILLIGPILYMVHVYSPNRTSDGRSVPEGLDTPARCLWYIYGALLQQGGMHLPQNDGARLIIGTWWLVVMVLVATYSGSLVAFLTFPRMHESISTIDDLLRHKDELTWSLPSRSYLEEYLKNGKVDEYDGLLGDESRPSERHNSSNYATVVDRVKNGGHVLVDWTSSLRMLTRIDNPLTNDGVCHFSIGTEAFLDEPIALLLPSNSPYLRLVNDALTRMHESGLIEKWASDRATPRDECWEGSGLSRQVDNHKVDVWDMQGIFFVLIIGYLIAGGFLAWEFYTHHRKLTRERNLIRPFVS